jgi:hypothetical protein
VSAEKFSPTKESSIAVGFLEEVCRISRTKLEGRPLSFDACSLTGVVSMFGLEESKPRIESTEY